jgi:acetyl esterase
MTTPSLDALAGDIAQFVAQVAAQSGPRLTELAPGEARRAFAAIRRHVRPGPQVATCTDQSIFRDGREIRLRVYEPQLSSDNVMLFLHGGGWTVGSIELSDASARHLAVAAHSTVVSVDYSLSPEHRFPTAVDDTVAALRWVRDLRGDVPVILVGESAGANLAAAIAGSGEAGPIAAQVLIYPVTDYDLDRPSYDDPIASLILSREDMRRFWENYLPNLADRGDPLASPLRARDFGGLPPTFVATAEFDVLRDEGEEYVSRLADAGVNVTHRRYAGTVHGFFSDPGRFEAAQQLLVDLVDFLQDNSHVRKN